MIVTDATRLPRVMQCLGSLTMPVSVPDFDDPEARDEGNAAHYMAQQVFHGADINTLIGQKAYNGYVMDAEMARHVSEYLAALDCGTMEVVTTITTDRWVVNARADHIRVTGWLEADPNATGPMTLTVDDFKYGHRLVEPEMNWTLIAHAIGHCINCCIAPDKIILRIHQPRRHHPEGTLREWSISFLELQALYQQMDERLSGADTTLITGPNCVKCHAAPSCPAWREASMNAIDATSAHFCDDLTPEQLDAELDLLEYAEDVITARLKAMQELARHKIGQGMMLPMRALETQYGHRKFKFSVAAIKALVSVPCTEEKLVTPAELERRGVSESTMKFLTERPMTGTKLIKSDPDKRARRQLKKGK